jgi:glyoxylase-like metal-dependent hydrolase (beta-lactamase superfamily II)
VERIIRVLAPNPSTYTLEGTNTWILGADPCLVIDPGPDIPAHLDEVAEAAGSVGAIAVTHDHPDHSPGARALAERVGATVRAWHLDGAEPLKDGDLLRVGDLEVRAIHTPGHTPDHVVFHLTSHGALFTGDAVLGRGTSFIDPPTGNLVSYLRSLERMQELGPRTLYPGHGPVVLDAGAKLQEYIDHRADRERQILEGLRSGPRRIPDIVVEVYAQYPPEVHELAGRSVLAHLLKLESEGRVFRDASGSDEVWSRLEPSSPR